MVEENKSLKGFSTFGTEVTARYFSEVHSLEELQDALKLKASTQEMAEVPILILGGGSNVLFTKNIEAFVLKTDLKGICEEIIDENTVIVTAAAGENWHQFVLYCLSKNYGGLENLSLIPGNVGTSPMQNIGAYGVEIKDVFVSCNALNLKTLEIEKFDRERCRFGYRESIFKHEAKGKYIILNVTFALTRENHSLHTDYGAIKSELQAMGKGYHPTIQDVSQAVINIRSSKLPNPALIGNAGSFFKNPVIPMQTYEPLKKLHPEIPGYSDGDLVKVPAGWLIEHCGWKGKQIGNVATHEKQSLVIVNKTGMATGKEIFDFSSEIIKSVKETFGITLEREVNVY